MIKCSIIIVTDVRHYIFLFLVMNFILSANAQTNGVVTSAGDNRVNGGLALSWTIGQTITSTMISSNKSVILTQGIQDKAVVTSTKENIELPPKLHLFPNPTDEILNIQFDSIVASEMELLVLDSQGKPVKSDLIGSTVIEKKIDMHQMPSGIYYIRLTKGNIVSVFKVVKL
jgi:hypothetical protein